jgi:structural maintenance of chromosome 3 (chondroitin sulfate proteoglycan 6)
MSFCRRSQGTIRRRETVGFTITSVDDRELWRLEAKTQAEEESAKQELRKAEQQLYNTMDRNIQTGLQAAARIAKDLNLTGYYGPLYDLFTLTDPRYRTAAEVTAGQRYPHRHSI